MHKVLALGAFVLIASIMLSCEKRVQPVAAAASQVVQVEQYALGGNPTRVERTDAATVQAIRVWLDQIVIRQPPQDEWGSVMPWRTIRLYQNDASGRTLEREVHIFTYADSTQSELLVTEEEQAEFDRIVSGEH